MFITFFLNFIFQVQVHCMYKVLMQGLIFLQSTIDPLFPQLTIIYLVIIWLLFIFLWTVFITIEGNNKSNIHVEITLISVIFLSDVEEKNKVLLSLERVKLFKIIFIYIPGQYLINLSWVAELPIPSVDIDKS